MPSTGVTVDADTMQAFSDMHMKKTLQLLVMYINKDSLEVKLDEKDSMILCTHDELVEVFKTKLADKAAYVVSEFKRPNGDKKLIFITWVPDSADRKDKMIYATSLEGIKPKFSVVKRFIQANDLTEISEEDINASF